MDTYENNLITGTIETEKDSFLLFMIPFDKNWELYVDGKVEAQRAPASGNSFQFPGNKWFVIGGDAGAANEADRAYKGQIAITRIYDRALTAEEVKALYNTLKE